MISVSTVLIGTNDVVVILGFVMVLGLGVHVWMISLIVGWIRRLFDSE
jgi:hypothetical protein